jgi:hypothetical protein
MSSSTTPVTATDPVGYAWNWFSLHSAQRMQMVNFWLVAVAFLGAAFVQATTSNLRVIAIGVSAAGAVCSVGFLLLDSRTRDLIRVAERALHAMETEQVMTQQAFPQLVHRAAVARSTRLSSYRLVIEGMQATVALLFLAAGIYSALA